jgi:hypothetical protein
MPNAYSMDDLLGFLDHAAKRGLVPTVTAQALAVASRNVLGVLTEDERKDLAQVDLDATIKRFTNKRAKDFNPSSLKVYGQRVRRAVTLFLDWRNDPASFTVKTRAPRSGAKRRNGAPDDVPQATDTQTSAAPARVDGAYQSSVPVRPGVVVTLSNIPSDLTAAEADRLASFIKMLAVK